MGVDTEQLEKSLQTAGRSIEKNLDKKGKPPRLWLPKYESPTQKAWNAFQGGGVIGLAGMALGLPGMVVEAIGMLIDGIKKLMDEARRLRNLSIETGLSFKELAGLNTLAETTGMSLENLAHSMAEFNKKMGEAKIRGSEANAALTKLGFGLEQNKNQGVSYMNAIKALNAAYKAGTDQATLMHYAVQLFGSSAEQLMPIIKGSVAQMQALEANTLHNTNTSINAMSRLSDQWTVFWSNLKTVAMEASGIIVASFYAFADKARQIGVVLMAAINPKLAAKTFIDTSVGMTDTERLKQAAVATVLMSESSGKEFMAEVINSLGKKGNKLSPLGLTEAQGASSLQQMGGGDIVSAMAFTPLERIATATEETAKNTAKPDLIDATPAVKMITGGILGF